MEIRETTEQKCTLSGKFKTLEKQCQKLQNEVESLNRKVELLEKSLRGHI